jgi:hypothetical protein
MTARKQPEIAQEIPVFITYKHWRIRSLILSGKMKDSKKQSMK